MPNVLIRDVPAEDLDQIRAAAAQQGTSLQGYLLDAVHAQASYLRRQAALARTGERLKGRAAVPEGEREAVLAAIQDDIEERGDQLSRRDT
jgi:hypothetical protein